MAEVLLKIEPSGREGVIAVGSYLIDAAARLGVRINDEPETGEHTCLVNIESGAELLSDLTAAERGFFETKTRQSGERLACQAKFVKAGEVTMKTEDTETTAESEETDEAASKNFRKEFEEMPLEKKIANLFQLELIAFGETINFIVNSPSKVVEKVMDVMAEFGLKKDEAAREASRPQEHRKKNSDDTKAPGGHAPAAG